MDIPRDGSESGGSRSIEFAKGASPMQSESFEDYDSFLLNSPTLTKKETTETEKNGSEDAGSLKEDLNRLLEEKEEEPWSGRRKRLSRRLSKHKNDSVIVDLRRSFRTTSESTLEMQSVSSAGPSEEEEEEEDFEEEEDKAAKEADMDHDAETFDLHVGLSCDMDENSLDVEFYTQRGGKKWIRIRSVGPWAKRFGLRAGMRVTHCNGLRVLSATEFRRAVAMTPHDDDDDDDAVDGKKKDDEDDEGKSATKRSGGKIRFFSVRILDRTSAPPPLPPWSPKAAKTTYSPKNRGRARHLYKDPFEKKWIPLLPPPPAVALWFNNEDSSWRRKQQMEAAFPWLEHALLAAYEDTAVKKAAKKLLGHYHFTPFLKTCGLMSRLQSHCRGAALRIGSRLHAYYQESNLRESLGTLKLPMLDAFGEGKLKVRQDHPSLRLPLPLHVATLHQSSPNFMRKFTKFGREEGWEYFEQESVLIHMLRLTALGIDAAYQKKVRKIVESPLCNGALKSVAIKGDARMRNKVLSYEDHRDERKPRPALNVDINRNCAVFETAEDLATAAKMLCEAFGGGAARVKNMFNYNERLAASKFHYRALMLNLVYDAGISYGELARRSRDLWSIYVSSPPENHSVPWGLWREEALSAVKHLRHPQYKKWRVRLVCEVQLVLRPYYSARQMMHLFYKVVRATNDKQLFDDFRLDERRLHRRTRSVATMTYESEQARMLEETKRALATSKDVNEAHGSEKETLLHRAARNGAVDATRWLLDENDADACVTTSKKRTPMYLAVKHGHREVLELLLKSLGEKNGRRKSVSLRDAHSMRLDGISLLYRAAEKAHFEILRVLLDYGTEGIDSYAKNKGGTPLMVAAEHGQYDSCKLLVKRGANVNFKGSGNRTALFVAAKGGFADICDLLITHGADVNAICRDVDGEPHTCLSVAAHLGNTRAVQVLHEHGAKSDSELLMKKRRRRSRCVVQ
eukprot:g528.t1